jgi:hypothetical protein
MKNNESGQSTIEFIFCFAFAVSLILLVFNSAMNFTTGYLAHYATFMASRVYLTSGAYGGSDSFAEADERAQATFAKYRLDIFGINNSAMTINSASTNTTPAEYLKVGVYTQFEQNIDAIGQVAGQEKLRLVSESFLGKEPSRNECWRRTCLAITGQETCTATMDITMYDDGC